MTDGVLGSGAIVHQWRPGGRTRGIVILQHGFSEHAGRYVTDHAALVPALVARGYEVWAPDLLGHGTSPGRRRAVDLHHAVRDNLELRQRAVESGRPIVLVGHSLGGLITAGSIAHQPGGIAGVVLSAPVLVRDTPAPLRAVTWALGRALGPLPMPGRDSDIEPLTRRPDVLERITADPLMDPGPVPFIVGATALEVSHDVWASAPSWQAPTLLVHGTADTVTDPRASSALIDRIGSPDKTLHLVNGGYHELLNDLDCDDTLALILGWIDQHTPSTQGEARG